MSLGHDLGPESKEAFKDEYGFINGTQRIWLKIASNGQRCASFNIKKMATTCSDMGEPHRKPDTKRAHTISSFCFKFKQ